MLHLDNPFLNNIILVFAGPRPLDVSLNAMPFRLLMSVVFCLCVWWAHHVRAPGEQDFPMYFYLVLLLFYALHQVKYKNQKICTINTKFTPRNILPSLSVTKLWSCTLCL